MDIVKDSKQIGVTDDGRETEIKDNLKWMCLYYLPFVGYVNTVVRLLFIYLTTTHQSILDQSGWALYMAMKQNLFLECLKIDLWD